MNRTLRGFLRKEFAQVLRDPRMRLIVFVVPIVQLTLFGVALSTEVKNIRLAAAIEPSDTIGRDLHARAIASGWFLPAKIAPGENDPFQWIRADRADAVLVAPPGGLTAALERDRGEVQLLVNATNVTRAQQVEVYFKAIVNEVLKEHRPLAGMAPPIRFDVRVLYNPAMVTARFMVPGVMSMILCVLTIILTAMSLAREKEIGTFETLVAAPVSTSEILFGKTVPYVILAMIDVVLILLAAVTLFDVPLNGPVWLLLTAAFIFVCATVGIGILISTIARSQQQAMMGGFLFLFPAVLLSGIMFPVENMPPALKILAYLNPMKYFVTLLRSIMLKGGDAEVALFNIAVLIGVAFLAVWYAFRRFKHTLE